MAQVAPFAKKLIEQAFAARPWKYMTDSDGDYRITFESGNSTFGDFNAIFSVAGSKSEMLRCYGFFDIKVQSEHFSQAIFLCNEFHVAHYAPCIYFRISEVEQTKIGRFWSQQLLDFENGIHVEALLTLLRQFVGSSNLFPDWAFKQPQFWK